MKVRDVITENEMVAVFLKAEITSTRFGGNILKILERDNKPKSIIENPNLHSEEENLYRTEVLKNHRGYAVNSLIFEGFPENVIWKKVLLSKEELQNVKYINYDYWVELSGGTRFVKDGAQNVLAGKEVFKEPNSNFIKAAEAVKQGMLFEKLIIVAQNEGSYLVVLEGHLRLTAYCMALEYLPEEMEVIVGFSEDIKNWKLY